MTTENPRLASATPVLRSGDYPRSRDFYVGKLGFVIVEEGGDPPRFGIFDRDGATLFVDAWHGAPVPAPEIWDAYIHVEGLDALVKAWRASGITLSREPTDTVYGMREFEVTDPDGNVICFGESLD